MTQEKLYFWGRWWKQVSTRVVFHLFVLFYLLYHHAICLVSCPNMWIESYRVQVENILPKILLTVSTSARPKFYQPFRLRRRSRKTFLSSFGTLYIIYIFVYIIIYYIYTCCVIMCVCVRVENVDISFNVDTFSFVPFAFLPQKVGSFVCLVKQIVVFVSVWFASPTKCDCIFHSRITPISSISSSTYPQCTTQCAM